MLKQPTTKKLSEKQVNQTITYDNEPFKKLFPNEKFYQLPKYSHIFVSQYANIISTSGKTPHLLKPYIEANGYASHVILKKSKRKKFYVHRLVAEVWCQKPDTTSNLQVHHKKKIRETPTIDVNFASNLEYVYPEFHPLIESIISIQVQRPSLKWKYVSELAEVAQYYHTSLYRICQILSENPETIEGKYEIYSSEHIHIKIRKEAKQ